MDNKNTYKSVLLYTFEFVVAYVFGRLVSDIMQPIVERLPSDALQILVNLISFVLLLLVIVKAHFIFRAWLTRRGWLQDRNH
jgi:hypothetical protein